MRTFLLALLLPCAALAQVETPPTETPTPTTGSATATGTTLVDDRDSAAAPTEGEAPPDDAAALPEKILMPPPPEAAPTVSIRTDNSGDIVEEYRQNGRLTMVKVRPQRGLPYTLIDTNGDGRLDAKDGEGPVRPVYWTIYEWN